MVDFSVSLELQHRIVTFLVTGHANTKRCDVEHNPLASQKWLQDGLQANREQPTPWHSESLGHHGTTKNLMFKVFCFGNLRYFSEFQWPHILAIIK